MDAVSQRLLFLNTQENAIWMTVKVKETQGLLHNALSIWIPNFNHACVGIHSIYKSTMKNFCILQKISQKRGSYGVALLYPRH